MADFTIKEALVGLTLTTFAVSAYGLNWQLKQDEIMYGYTQQIESQQQLNNDLKEANKLLRERLELQERLYKGNTYNRVNSPFMWDSMNLPDTRFEGTLE
jgi:hypothetical protein